MVVCRMTIEARKKKRLKAEPQIKWCKLRKEDCCEQFREEVKQALSCCEKEMHEWATVADVVRKTGRKVLGVSSGQKKEDRDTWWWNEEVQNVLEERDWPKRTGITRGMKKIDRSTRICAVKLKEL